jgi:FixJ family two-component response regulator
LEANVQRTLARTIHIVDDDDAVRDSLRALLESYDFLVTDHASGDDFLREFSGLALGCVLLDIHMPGISGLELLKILRSRGLHIPAIVISGRADSELGADLIQNGALAVFDKPVDNDELILAIEAAFAD